ncbi:hypothetical protein [Peptoniphilus asaccharolyticus]
MKFIKILGIFFMVGSIGGFLSGEISQALIALLVGITMFFVSKKYKSKSVKKEIHIFRCEVKGHFLHERQRTLSKLFRENYNKEIEEDETQISNYLKFIEEPSNEYDPNAIAIFTKDDYGEEYIKSESGNFYFDVNISYSVEE